MAEGGMRAMWGTPSDTQKAKEQSSRWMVSAAEGMIARSKGSSRFRGGVRSTRRQRRGIFPPETGRDACLGREEKT